VHIDDQRHHVPPFQGHLLNFPAHSSVTDQSNLHSSSGDVSEFSFLLSRHPGFPGNGLRLRAIRPQRVPHYHTL